MVSTIILNSKTVVNIDNNKKCSKSAYYNDLKDHVTLKTAKSKDAENTALKNDILTYIQTQNYYFNL